MATLLLQVQCGGGEADRVENAPPPAEATRSVAPIPAAAEPTADSATDRTARTPAGTAEAPDPIADFLRIRRDDAGRMLALETAITRYVRASESGDPVSVDLIGAVHMGEESYYATLNEEFTRYDALLYELVAPEGARIPDPTIERGGFNPVSSMQTFMSDQLELEFQLDHIDYTAVNFVHADMSPLEFTESMDENDESVGSLFFRVFAYSLNSWRPSTDISLALAYLSNNKAMRLRRTMAKELLHMDDIMAVLEGPEGSTLIKHRNGKAFEVLERELAAGRRELAIFYGAAHLPEMQERLLVDLGFTPESRRWVIAWRLADASSVEPSLEVEDLRSLAEAPDAER